VNIWREAHGLAFSADVVERNVSVLSHGLIELYG